LLRSASKLKRGVIDGTDGLFWFFMIVDFLQHSQHRIEKKAQQRPNAEAHIEKKVHQNVD
jgi:hypothetical protein